MSVRGDLQSRFEQHDMDSLQEMHSRQLRGEALDLADTIDAFVPDSREKSLAFTHLEEAVMWANKGLAMHGGEKPYQED